MSRFQPLERPHYFSGRLLSAEDLRCEQEYVLARLRRLNRFTHGWGVVAGLGVSQTGSGRVVVQPGLAIDCVGNEIVLCEERRISIPALAGRQYLVVSYAEVGVDEIPTPGGSNEYARLRESAKVEFIRLNPCANHRGMGRGTIGCGLAHPLCLATISKQGSRWRVAASFRRVSSTSR